MIHLCTIIYVEHSLSRQIVVVSEYKWSLIAGLQYRYIAAAVVLNFY